MQRPKTALGCAALALVCIETAVEAAHFDRLVEQLAAEDDAEAAAALDALEALPGVAATEALVDAMAASGGARQHRLIEALGRRGDAAAIPALKALARSGDVADDVRWACLDALARLGVPPPNVLARQVTFDHTERHRYAQAGITAADALAAVGRAAEAEAVYATLADLHTPRPLVCAAIEGLGKLGSPKLLSVALGFLDDPHVRETAIKTLAAAPNPQIEEKLVRAYRVVNAPKQTGILRVLALREAPGLSDVLAEAREADSAEVRLVAAELSGHVPAAEDMLAAARGGSVWIRTRAIEAYIERASTMLDEGCAEDARGMLEAAAVGDFPVEQRKRAIEALGRVASPASWALLVDLLDQREVTETARQACLAVCAAIKDPEEAKARLVTLLDTAPAHSETALAAGKALGERGADLRRMAADRGYVTSWRVAGPIARGDAQEPPEPACLDAATPVVHRGEAYGWRTLRTEGLPAWLEASAPEGSVIYALAEVMVDKEQGATLLVGRRGACRVWLNGHP
ncbi:MAG TPA: hypothetical protein ENN80_03895, partial [Candidatus Hydrogenedentes bacterium]|nr:hypothetical protein [Candidatus Hydrogenedentota bacterium]